MYQRKQPFRCSSTKISLVDELFSYLTPSHALFFFALPRLIAWDGALSVLSHLPDVKFLQRRAKNSLYKLNFLGGGIGGRENFESPFVRECAKIYRQGNLKSGPGSFKLQ